MPSTVLSSTELVVYSLGVLIILVYAIRKLHWSVEDILSFMILVAILLIFWGFKL